MGFKLTTIIFGIFLIAMLTFVSAAKETDTTNKATEKNLTYGQCVSDNAALKNTCYSDVKAEKETCRDNAKNITDAKTADKTCKNDYKKAMKDCKADFKKSKQECKKIKHNAFETIANSMK